MSNSAKSKAESSYNPTIRERISDLLGWIFQPLGWVFGGVMFFWDDQTYRTRLTIRIAVTLGFLVFGIAGTIYGAQLAYQIANDPRQYSDWFRAENIAESLVIMCTGFGAILGAIESTRRDDWFLVDICGLWVFMALTWIPYAILAGNYQTEVEVLNLFSIVMIFAVIIGAIYLVASLLASAWIIRTGGAESNY